MMGQSETLNTSHIKLVHNILPAMASYDFLLGTIGDGQLQSPVVLGT
jgi:hypothetical protein